MLRQMCVVCCLRGLVGSVAVTSLHTAVGVAAEDSVDSGLEAIEPRLTAIYQKREFSFKRFHGEWLPDSSGYRLPGSNRGAGAKTPLIVDVQTGKPREADDSASTKGKLGPNRSPDGKSLIVREKGMVKVRDVESGRTTDIVEVNPQAAVSIGRTQWSPDSNRILFVQTDSSRVRLRSMIVPGDPSYPEVREMRFTRVGGKIPKLKVGVAERDGGDINWLAISEPDEDFYLGQIKWAENSNEVLIEKRSRFRDKRECLLVNVATGGIKPIFKESDPAWVVASIDKNAGPEWIKGGREFVVLSEKDGWRQAYVYSRDGQELRLLTPGDYDIIEKVKVDEAGGWFYFNASPENGTRKALYRVPLAEGGEPERVTPAHQPGYHEYDFSPDGKWAFHTWSTFDSPPVTELVQFPEHRVVRVLEDNAALREKIASLPQQESEFLKIDIGNGVVMDSWMIKPSHFDPEKKYPVLVYVYGEPHAQTVLDRWNNSSSDYHRAVAELGYLVVSIDNRGTPAPKGAAWRRAVFGSLGPLSTEEQAAGIKKLGEMCPFVDLSRVAIWGWSGGGSNTLNAMFRKPDHYHVGIAVVPKPQPHLYNAWFQEIYMETRETNPGGYERSAPINFAGGLKGDLLIIHGTGETNTHLQIVEGLVDRLVELGKPFDYMAYPNRNHGISEGRGTSLHMRLLMVRYLLTHLRAGGE